MSDRGNPGIILFWRQKLRSDSFKKTGILFLFFSLLATAFSFSLDCENLEKKNLNMEIQINELKALLSELKGNESQTEVFFENDEFSETTAIEHITEICRMSAALPLSYTVNDGGEVQIKIQGSAEAFCRFISFIENQKQPFFIEELGFNCRESDVLVDMKTLQKQSLFRSFERLTPDFLGCVKEKDRNDYSAAADIERLNSLSLEPSEKNSAESDVPIPPVVIGKICSADGCFLYVREGAGKLKKIKAN